MAKSVYFLLVITALICSASSCSRKGDDAGQRSAAEAAQESVDVAQLTDAAQALAAGDRLFENNRTEEAIQAYLRAVELDPDLAEAYFKLGVAYALIEKEQKEAAKEDVNSVEGSPGDKTVPESEKAFKKAVAAYKRILDKEPENDVAYYNLGRAYNKLNEDHDAAKALRQAVKLKPEEVEYQIELGAVLIKLAQYREAIPPLKKALELDPENSKATELLEDAEAGRSRIDYARKDAERAANSNSNSNANSKPDDDADDDERPSANADQSPPKSANTKRPEPRPTGKP
ncbi:MAG: tetratricopeptide repeat protein [Pyrinomonadaceae bacterium]